MALEDPGEHEEVRGAPAEPAAALDRHERDELGPGLHTGVAAARVCGERHPCLGGRGPERLPRTVVVGADPRPRCGEVHALQPGGMRPAQLLDRRVDVPDRELREPDVAVGRVGADSREPAVVDPDAFAREVRVVGRSEHRRLERDRLVVLASVEDHLGGDTLEVEVAPAGDGVVMPCGRTVAPRRHALLPRRGDRVLLHIAAARTTAARGVCVEVGEQPGRAKGPKVLDEAGPDVAVRGDDHEWVGHTAELPAYPLREIRTMPTAGILDFYRAACRISHAASHRSLWGPARS